MNPLLNDDKNDEQKPKKKKTSVAKNGRGREMNNENRQHHNYRMQFQTLYRG